MVDVDRAVDFYSVNNFLKYCIICNCILDDDNWAGSRNVCKSCLAGLEF